MEAFEVQFREKIKKLTNSQQSIESLSLWLLYHSKLYKNSAKIWEEEILRASPVQQLTLLYVCNDLLQNSRKKTQNFINEFSDVLLRVFPKIYG
jgi:regulator of Ty1 transposition protein 103